MSINNVENMAAVAAKSANTIRALTEKVASQEKTIAELSARLETKERAESARALATEMEQKGLNSELTFEEKVASLSSYDNLETVREAIGMASAGYIKIANVSESPSRGGSVDALTAFCLGAE